jgi:hypothetical protein
MELQGRNGNLLSQFGFTVCGEWRFSSFRYLTGRLCNAIALSVSQNWMVGAMREGGGSTPGGRPLVLAAYGNII